MKSSTLLGNRKQTAAFRIVSMMLAIAPLWLMLAAANTSAYGQTSDDVSNSSTAAASSPADWTEFHRDNMQRWNPYETVLGVGNVANLKLKWKNPIGSYGSYRRSSPAVVNGIIYFGSSDGNVYALNANTGAKLWSYHTAAGIERSSPAVANGVVYVGSGDGSLYALDASTGAKLWSYATPIYGLSGNAIDSSPTVVNGAVYFGSDDGNVFALNASTGALLWSYHTGNVVVSSPAVVNGAVYFGSNDQNFYALNASTGAKLWGFDTAPSTADSSPAVVNGVVYFGTGNLYVYALNATTGVKLWSYRTGGGVSSSPAVANGVVYVGSLDDHTVYALNASTGAKLWSYNTGYYVDSSPAVANGVVYITNTDLGANDIGNLYALDASTGALLWSYPIPTDTSSATVVDGAVYIQAGNVPSFTGNVYAFSLGSDLFLRIWPSTTTVHQGDLITYAFPVWNLGPNNAYLEVLKTQVPPGTVIDYIRISGTPGLGTCTRPPYGGTGQIICHEGDGMAPNTTWTVRLTVKVTAAAGSTITANAATLADTPDPNTANNTATASLKVQ